MPNKTLKICRLVLFLWAAFAALPMCAALRKVEGERCTQIVNGVAWDYIVNNNCAVVGWSDILVPAIDPETSGDIIVPSSLGGYPVVALNNYAFSGCANLTSVTVPSGVTNIETYAWRNCSALTSVSLPNTVTHFGDSVFQSCVALKDCILPDSVKIMGRDMFWRCSSITNIHFPSEVEVLGVMTCFGCVELESVDLPSKLIAISNTCFSGCSNLVIDELPDSLEAIGGSAFNGCQKMPCLELPRSLSYIENGAFSGCPLFNELIVDPDNTNFVVEAGVLYNSAETGIAYVLDDAIITSLPDTLTEIPYGAFSCRTIALDSLPPSVRRIGDFAFANCKVGKRLSLPTELEYIGKQAFYRSGLLLADDIALNAVDSLPDQAFEGCTGIRTLELNKVGIVIGNNVFNGCTGLESLTLPSMVSIGIRAFIGCTALKELHIPPDFVHIEASAFDGCTAFGEAVVADDMLVGLTTWHVTDFTVPEGVTRIAGCALADHSVTNLVLSSGLTNIDASAVAEMSSLRVLQVPSGLTCIGDDLFVDSHNLDTMIIHDKGVGYRLPLSAFSSLSQPLQTTAKRKADGNYTKYWEEYVLGTDPNNPRDLFTVRITITGGQPEISWHPDFRGSPSSSRVYQILGKHSLVDESWCPITESETGDYNFFKVSVALP